MHCSANGSGATGYEEGVFHTGDGQVHAQPIKYAGSVQPWGRGRSMLPDFSRIPVHEDRLIIANRNFVRGGVVCFSGERGSKCQVLSEFVFVE